MNWSDGDVGDRRGVGGTLLVAPTGDPWRACRSFLDDALDAVDALVGVAVDRRAELLVDDWRDWVGASRNLAVVDVGEEMRSTAVGGQSGWSPPVRALPYSALASLPDVVGGYLDDWNDAGRPSAVYVEGAASLVADSDVPTAVEVLARLRDRAGSVGAGTYVAAPTDTLPSVSSALVPLFDAVVDVDPEGNGRVRETATPDLPPDRTFDLLSSARRRHALHYLASRDGPVPVDELVRAVADRSADGDRDRALLALRQFDLPKLTDAGVVVHDAEADAVEPTHRFRSLRPHLALAARDDLPDGAGGQGP